MIRLAVLALRPVEAWHAWRWRVRKARHKFDRPAVTTRRAVLRYADKAPTTRRDDDLEETA